MNNTKIPKNAELETEVLAIIAQNPGDGLCRHLRDTCFTDHRKIVFQAIEALGDTLTHPRLRSELEKAGHLNEGVGKLLADIFAADLVPVALLDDNAAKLGDLAQRRRGIVLAAEIERDAGDVTREFRLDEKAQALLAAEGVSPFAEMLARSAMPGTDFLTKEFPPRPSLIGDWYREGDLGFIFAPRGVGKTWYAHMLIAALTAGKDLGPWSVPNKARVCLLDGEMPPDAVQERLRKLEVDGEMLTVHSHQFLFDLCGRGFQLGDSEQRAALLDYCVSHEIQVLVIDNLSSVSNVSENDNDEWMKLGDWLLEFRRNGVSVIVVHHAGRNGNMRGASRREDPAFWIVRLDDSKERTATEDGARFVSTFTKSRNSRSTPPPLDWHVTEDESGKFLVEYEAAGTDELVLQCIKDGLDRCSDIAAELDKTKGTVSKAAAKLESSGRISITGKGNQARYSAN